MIQNKKYIINRQTMALVPYHMVGSGRFYTKVFELYRNILVEQSPLEIIEFSMQKYAANYQGAKEASEYHLRIKQVLPIKVCGKLDIYLFPTKNVKSLDCVWLCLDPIIHFERVDTRTMVHFTNGDKIEIDMPLSKLERQVNLTNQLRVRLTKVVAGKMVYHTSGCTDGMRLYKENQTDVNYRLVPQTQLTELPGLYLNETDQL